MFVHGAYIFSRGGSFDFAPPEIQVFYTNTFYFHYCINKTDYRMKTAILIQIISNFHTNDYEDDKRIYTHVSRPV